MNELSKRMRLALDFIKESGIAESDADITRRLGVARSHLSMAASGARVPTWETLLSLCDNYPISFDWIRTGEGEMVTKGSAVLIERIAELQRINNNLRNENKELKSSLK